MTRRSKSCYRKGHEHCQSVGSFSPVPCTSGRCVAQGDHRESHVYENSRGLPHLSASRSAHPQSLRASRSGFTMVGDGSPTRGSAKNCAKFQVTTEQCGNFSRHATSRTLILAAVIALFFKGLCGFSPPLGELVRSCNKYTFGTGEHSQLSTVCSARRARHSPQREKPLFSQRPVVLT
jgi:hypothetical protein